MKVWLTVVPYGIFMIASVYKRTKTAIIASTWTVRSTAFRAFFITRIKTAETAKITAPQMVGMPNKTLSPRPAPETMMTRQMLSWTMTSTMIHIRMAKPKLAPSCWVKVAVWVKKPGPTADMAIKKAPPNRGVANGTAVISRFLHRQFLLT